MSGSTTSLIKASDEVAGAGATDGTIRIEHDRRRLALAAAISGIATIALPCMIIFSRLNPARAAPAWTLAPMVVALLASMLGFVRSIVRLQDGDPALVISPRGLNFRPYLFGEIVRIPWNAIRGFKVRRYKQQRFIVLQIDSIDRYAPRAGFHGFGRRLGRGRLAADEISFSTLLGRSAWKDVETTLQRYLERYGRTPATNRDAGRGTLESGIAGRRAKSLPSGSTP